MKALVTGAGGFVGRHLVGALRESGWRVLTASRRGPADLVGDLLRIPLRGISVDVVFHLAGFANPSASVLHASLAYAGNAAAAARIVRELRAGRFVLASTCQVYAPHRAPVEESAGLAPRTPYSASKLCGEALARASGRDVVVIRPFNHTGPGQSDDYVCPRIARQIARAEAGLGPRIVQVGARSPRLDLFDVRDMALAYRLAAEKARRGEIYNVATGHPVLIEEILGLLMAESRIPLGVQGPQGIPGFSSGDSRKFRAATGWSPRIPLRQTLRDLLDYERSLTA
jgi:GDP-4-dehydro-6-deoxy-D-mannose reductase